MIFRRDKKGREPVQRRQFERIDFIQASYFTEADSGSGENAHDCWFNNISVGGMSFDIREESLREGDVIIVLYKLGTKIMRDRVLVQYARRVLNNWRCGCTFLDSDGKRDDFIIDYIEQNMKGAGRP